MCNCCLANPIPGLGHSPKMSFQLRHLTCSTLSFRSLSTSSSRSLFNPTMEERKAALSSAMTFLSNLELNPPPLAGSGHLWIGDADANSEERRRNRDLVDLLDLELSPEPYASSLSNLLGSTLDPAARLSMDDNAPGYLAFVPSGGMFHSSLADFLSSSLNRYVTIQEAAPALAKIEDEVVKFLCDKIAGYDVSTGGGVLTSGGSIANLVGIHAARRAAIGNKDLQMATLYVSEQSHYCVAQAARFVGLQPKHVRLIKSNFDCTMDVGSLKDSVTADVKEGLVPIAVCATAGTTNSGAVDDLKACRDVCEEHGNIWLHVDAAYGGAFALTGQGRDLMDGISSADSVVVDPHKGLFVPYGLGALLVKDRSKLVRANHEDGACMHPPAFFSGPGSDPDPDIMNLSPELTRSFRGLKLWLPLKLLGHDAFTSELEEKLRLASLASELLSSSGAPHLVVCHAPQLSVLTFKLSPPGMAGSELDAHQLKFLKIIHEKGRCLLSTFRSVSGKEGELQIRMCVLSFMTDEGAVRDAVEDVVEAAEEAA